MAGTEGPIGFFDSGAGGISVLAQAIERLPGEDFLYFGDSAHTPYGEKSNEWIVERSRYLTRRLLDRGAKAVVIACNTATAAAGATLREDFPEVPIVGVEPALKPATLLSGVTRILVMATPMTLRLDKYHSLEQRWGEGHEIESVECPGLAARIEQGDLEGEDLKALLEDLIGAYEGWPDAVVLGCTHYIFAADALRSVLGEVPFIDGAFGTARHLEDLLRERGLLREGQGAGAVTFATSAADETLQRYEDLLRSLRGDGVLVQRADRIA